MARGASITKEMVAKVKRIKAKYPEMTNADLGELCGTSESSVGRILAGGYDEKETAATADELIPLLASIAASLEKLTETQMKLEVV